MKEKKYIISALVENKAGVLSRMSGLFTRRGYNIDSLAVAETENPAISRMTITLKGDADIVEQIEKQLEKQTDVLSIKLLTQAQAVFREHVLVKINCNQAARTEANTLVEIFRAKVIDVSYETLTMELTGDTKKIDAFIKMLLPFGIVQVVRSGVTAIERGEIS